jgi:hypothetical protein
MMMMIMMMMMILPTLLVLFFLFFLLFCEIQSLENSPEEDCANFRRSIVSYQEEEEEKEEGKNKKKIVGFCLRTLYESFLLPSLQGYICLCLSVSKCTSFARFLDQMHGDSANDQRVLLFWRRRALGLGFGLEF